MPEEFAPYLKIIYWILGGIAALVAAYTAYRLSRRRQGVLGRLQTELGLEAVGSSKSVQRLSGPIDGVQVRIALANNKELVVAFLELEDAFPAGMRLANKVAPGDVANRISYDGTVFVGSWPHWCAVLAPEQLQHLDTIGRYFWFDHNAERLVLRPKVEGLFEDFVWFSKTLRRLAAVISHTRTLTDDQVVSLVATHLGEAPEELRSHYQDAANALGA